MGSESKSEQNEPGGAGSIVFGTQASGLLLTSALTSSLDRYPERRSQRNAVDLTALEIGVVRGSFSCGRRPGCLLCKRASSHTMVRTCLAQRMSVATGISMQVSHNYRSCSGMIKVSTRRAGAGLLGLKVCDRM